MWPNTLHRIKYNSNALCIYQNTNDSTLEHEPVQFSRWNTTLQPTIIDWYWQQWDAMNNTVNLNLTGLNNSTHATTQHRLLPHNLLNHTPVYTAQLLMAYTMTITLHGHNYMLAGALNLGRGQLPCMPSKTHNITSWTSTASAEHSWFDTQGNTIQPIWCM